MPSAGRPQDGTVRLCIPSSSQIQWAYYKKCKVERKAKTNMCQCAASTFENSCGCTSLDIVESREMTEQIDWLENQPSQMVYVSEDPKCWGTRDTALGHKAKDIFTVWIALRREAWKAEVFDDLHRKDKRGPSSIRRTLELFERQRWEISERRDEAHNCELFRARRYHLELNWTNFVSQVL